MFNFEKIALLKNKILSLKVVGDLIRSTLLVFEFFLESF